MRVRVLGIAIAVSMLAGCGGGGGGAVTPSNPGSGGSGSHTGQTAQAQLTITIPGSGSGTESIRPNYVSQNARSLTIVVDGQTFEYDLTATSNGCTQPGGTGTEVTCTESLDAPVGTYTWDFTLWSATGGTGSELGLDSQNETITAGIDNQLTVTLNGVVGSYSLAWQATPSFTEDDSSAQTATLLLTAKDPSGAVIISPGTYVDSSGNTVTFTFSDNQPSGSVYTTYGYALGTTSTTQPQMTHGVRTQGVQPQTTAHYSNAVTVTYEGVSIPAVTFYVNDSAGIQTSNATSVTLAANLGTLAATVTCNETSNNDACSNGTGAVGGGGTAGSASFLGGGDTATVAISEPGWTDSPYSQSVSEHSNTCTGGASGVTLSGSSPNWTLTANTGDNPGSCASSFEDGTSNDQIVTVDGSYTYETIVIEGHHRQ